MARQCRQMNPGSGCCDLWDEDDCGMELPSGCDPETGECNPSNDWTEDCTDFFSTEEEECDECGEPMSECRCDDEEDEE